MTLPESSLNITLSSEVISPDGDGVDDEVILHLQLNEPGWVGTILVYNIHGSKIRALMTNYLLGTDEYLAWDGKRTDGGFADIGLYLLYGEIFSSRGERKNFKKVIPLIRK
jgi:hypothetical protein